MQEKIKDLLLYPGLFIKKIVQIIRKTGTFSYEVCVAGNNLFSTNAPYITSFRI